MQHFPARSPRWERCGLRLMSLLPFIRMTTDATDAQDLRTYEIAFLYPTNISQKEESTLLKEVDAILEEAGAKLIDQETWKDVGLAYPIKKHERGRMAIRYYEMSPDQLKQVDTSLRIVPNLLRHMIVKPEDGDEIVKYADRYEEWKNWQREQGERSAQEEEEQLRKKIVTKATRKEASPAPAKKESSDKEEGANLEDKLGELISDEDLKL
jgi:ribosomal protein S6